jgi:hypothetical protein
MTRQFVVWNSLKCDHGQCRWAIIDGLLTVHTQHGSKTITCNGGSPESPARVLIWEIESDLDGLPE